jgi:TPP-dependent pyruvate/acetoin dehydrogenase alpha subunit
MRYEPPNISQPDGRYEMMLLIRAFEEQIDRLFAEGAIHGTAQLCIGQEACAVGAIAALRPSDPVVSSHRGHGHFLARGGDPASLMGEMLGKATGPCCGRGGSQHLCALELSFYGTNGITGGGIPTATGLALSRKLSKSTDVVLCCFGDGAVQQGTFHESLNMASLWNLPVVYFCENNLYAMSTPLSESTKNTDIAGRANAYGMLGLKADGMDVEKVKSVVEKAAEHARRGDGPVLVEAACYRFCGHSKSDRLLYRTREEEAAWRARDPLNLCRQRLRADGMCETALTAIEKRAVQRIEEAYRRAQAAPEPSPEQVLVSPYRESRPER